MKLPSQVVDGILITHIEKILEPSVKISNNYILFKITKPPIASQNHVKHFTMLITLKNGNVRFSRNLLLSTLSLMYKYIFSSFIAN